MVEPSKNLSAVELEGGIHTFDSFARSLIEFALDEAVAKARVEDFAQESVGIEGPARIEVRFAKAAGVGELGPVEPPPCCICFIWADGRKKCMGRCCKPGVA